MPEWFEHKLNRIKIIDISNENEFNIYVFRTRLVRGRSFFQRRKN